MIKFFRSFHNLGQQILKIDLLRNYFCWMRYRFMLRSKLRFYGAGTDSVGRYTIEHNLQALNHRAGFGTGGRMSLLLYPLAAAMRGRDDAKVLIVGPRTEDDIYWARALGLSNVRGFDLFSYSPWIDIGDIHQTNYADGEFDAVILGWVISYSQQPEHLVAECKRIVKRGGYLGFGIEGNPEHRQTGIYKPPRVNALNSGADIARLVNEPITFIHDPALEVPTDNAVIFQLTQRA